MEAHPSVKSSFRVSPNIALIKYWGKYCEDLILPLNSSFSVTLSEEDLYTETTVEFSPKYTEDTLILNDKSSQLTKRLVNVISYFRERLPETLELNGKTYTRDEIKNWHFNIVSKNNFPTAAGLASSSSGIACLVLCLQDILKFKEEYEGQISEIARIGSGSASRSIYGGGVEWYGIQPELFGKEMLPKEEREKLSKQCIAKQVFGYEKFKDIDIIILVAKSEKKDVPSTSGMATSVQTSELIKHRVKHVVPERIASIKEAIQNEDWSKVFEITMRDSNNFHAICLDTYPPIFYMNSISHNVIKVVSKINEAFEKNQLAYTFDAGANAVLLVHKSISQDIARLFISLSQISSENVDEKLRDCINSEIKDEKLKKLCEELSILKDGLQFERIIFTKVGKGPYRLN